jgi:hypothetical protein
MLPVPILLRYTDVMSRARAPEPTIEDARFVLRALIGLAVFGALVAVGFSVVLGTSLTGGRGGDAWETYRNRDYGYEVRYPQDWTIEVRDPQPDDDFETQSVRLVRDATDLTRAEWSPGVLVVVNLQGGWCETDRVETHPITVSGVEGEEYVCYQPNWPCTPEPACREQPVFIGRFFEEMDGRPRYAVLGQTEDDVDSVRRIVESFRFLR